MRAEPVVVEGNEVRAAGFKFARHIHRHSPYGPATRPQIVHFRRCWQRSLPKIRPRTPHHEPRGAAKGRMDRIGRNQGAPLPWLSLQRMTNGRFTSAQDQAVATTARSAAGSRRRASSARPPQPSGRRHSGHGYEIGFWCLLKNRSFAGVMLARLQLEPISSSPAGSMATPPRR